MADIEGAGQPSYGSVGHTHEHGAPPGHEQQRQFDSEAMKKKKAELEDSAHFKKAKNCLGENASANQTWMVLGFGFGFMFLIMCGCALCLLSSMGHLDKHVR